MVPTAERHPWNLISQPADPLAGELRREATIMPGSAATPLRLLLEHDRWATRRLLDCCADLSADEFDKQFDMGVGTLRKTLTHIIGAMRRWIDRISGDTLRPSIESETLDVAQLIAMHEQVSATFTDLAQRVTAEGGFDEPMSVELIDDAGVKQRFDFTKGSALMHVLVHGTHHRAQCAWMLRRVRPDFAPPDIDVIEWAVLHRIH